jgi:hypothetical protein
MVASFARPFAYRIANIIEHTPLGILIRRPPAMRTFSSAR